jgi:hypothetical protein
MGQQVIKGKESAEREYRDNKNKLEEKNPQEPQI